MNKKKLFYIIVFLFFLIILSLSPISGDDWGNYGVGKLGLYHSIGNAIGMYSSWEGRFISRVLINVLTYYKFLWNIINSFLITLTVYFSIKIVNPRNRKLSYLLIMLIIFGMNVYTFSQTITWIAGNITYFFVIPIILGYFYYLLRDDTSSKMRNIIFIFVNIIIPMFVEHMALVLILGNLIIVGFQYLRDRKINKIILFYTFFSIISTAIMLLSPGSHARSLIENIEFNKLGLFGKIGYNLPSFINYTFIVNSFMLVFLTISNYLLIIKNVKNMYFKIILLIFILVIPCFTIILYPLANFYNSELFMLIESNNIFVLVYWIVYLIISFGLLFINALKNSEFKIIFIFLLGLIANGVMLLSPTWGYRTSLFTMICLSLVSIMVIDQYAPKYMKAFYLEVPITIVMIIYLVLYINVYRCQIYLVESIKKQLDNGKDIIEIEQFPNFINCNINPESEYHISKFKEYYKIPLEKGIKLLPKNWKYLIIYDK